MARTYTTIFFALVLAGLALIFQAANGDVYYVVSNVRDCRHVYANASCNTLDNYASSTTLRVNDSVFYFMPGKHLLRHRWRIKHAHNITLTSQFPASESSEDVIVVVRHGSDLKPSEQAFYPALSFYSSHSIQLSNLTISGSKEFICLLLSFSSGYFITNSVFLHCGDAISIFGYYSGKLESISFLDCFWVVRAMQVKLDNEQTPNLQMHRIYSSGSTKGAAFVFCSKNFSLTNSYFIDSGPLDICTTSGCGGEYPHARFHARVRN